jgi:hypothetical protein
MVLRLNEGPTIENLGKDTTETVETLRALLAAGAAAHADPHRADFYEIEDAERVYYIHISPVNGHVLLLGSWPRQMAAHRDDLAAD